HQHPLLLPSNLNHPFKIKPLLPQSAITYPPLPKNPITPLSKPLAKPPTSINTPQGPLSQYHLKPNRHIIYQIPPPLFPLTHHHPNFNKHIFINLPQHHNLPPFQINLPQPPKTPPAHIQPNKLTQHIPPITNLKPYQTINSPNPFHFIKNPTHLLNFVNQ
ncbi:glutamate synthase-related protein, partial [Staphylococcus epidermidis]|uniref:glutamate synthase-related protein n=1 Tax=Staphylococcus epidermidis TaxID=1282 RepID=UPI0037DA5AC5